MNKRCGAGAPAERCAGAVSVQSRWVTGAPWGAFIRTSDISWQSNGCAALGSGPETASCQRARQFLGDRQPLAARGEPDRAVGTGIGSAAAVGDHVPTARRRAVRSTAARAGAASIEPAYRAASDAEEGAPGPRLRPTVLGRGARIRAARSDTCSATAGPISVWWSLLGRPGRVRHPRGRVARSRGWRSIADPQRADAGYRRNASGRRRLERARSAQRLHRQQ